MRPLRPDSVGGTVVKICNHGHVWHGEIAIVRDIKIGFYRVELLGRLVWIPTHWAVKHEPDVDN